ncbi:leucine rich adaptor protein 1-like [Arapaima gigas]
MEEDRVLPDFRDIETKLGRKVPEILVQCLAEGVLQRAREEKKPAVTLSPAASTDLRRLESKMLFLKQEMDHLRAIDGRLMQQLLAINEGIESIRWAMEDKGVEASHDSSLAGSLYSLSESPDTSARGSSDSLQCASDGLDGISVGSYLDTLAEDLPDHSSPLGVELLSGEVLKELRVDTDEYYCFA